MEMCTTLVPGMDGYPIAKERERQFRNRMRNRMREYKSGKSPRTSALPERWWDKRPKPVDKGMRTLERLIGPAAYRGAHRLNVRCWR